MQLTISGYKKDSKDAILAGVALLYLEYTDELTTVCKPETNTIIEYNLKITDQSITTTISTSQQAE